MTIFERVNQALAALSPAVPYALHPYKGALPETFITYQLLDSSPEQAADNLETERSYLVQVNCWSVDGVVVLPNVEPALLAAGFRKGSSRQIPQDQATGHYGLATDYSYSETKE